MDDVGALLQNLPATGFGFMLVIARVGTTMLTGPALGSNEIPAQVRIALAALLSALVYPALAAALPAMPGDVAGLVGLIALEVIVGAWMGFITRVLVMALEIAGGFISLMIGTSSVLQLDPSLGTQISALQRMLALGAIALLFASGLYVLPVQAIIGSYDVIKPGSLFDAGGGAQLVTRAVADSFALSLRLAAPFVITGLVWQATLGFMSRLVPHIQVHVVSAPAQILGGFALLAAAMIVIVENWSADMLRLFSALPGL
jgi:flagellar biosynthetic protein FliR